MKITAQQYAKSLYEATKEKSQNEIDNAVKNFTKILIKNSHLKLEANIIKKFKEIYNAENKIAEAEVISREVLSNTLLNNVSKYVSTKYQAKEVVLNNRIDKNIQGGIIIKVGDEVMDGSVERQLRELKECLNH